MSTQNAPLAGRKPACKASNFVMRSAHFFICVNTQGSNSGSVKARFHESCPTPAYSVYFGLPPAAFSAATMLREAWHEVRRRLAAVARAEWLDYAAGRMFSGNAREVYRVTS